MAVELCGFGDDAADGLSWHMHENIAHICGVYGLGRGPYVSACCHLADLPFCPGGTEH